MKINAFIAGKDRQDQRLRPSEYFICGMFTGAVAALVEGPIDLVRIEFLVLFLESVLNGVASLHCLR